MLLAGMIPLPGETPAQWWEATGYQQAAADCAALSHPRELSRLLVSYLG